MQGASMRNNGGEGVQQVTLDRLTLLLGPDLRFTVPILVQVDLAGTPHVPHVPHVYLIGDVYIMYSMYLMEDLYLMCAGDMCKGQQLIQPPTL